MDMQNVSNLQIPEGAVRTIHDKDNRLIWGRVAYNTKYAGNTIQNGAPTPDTPIPVQTVTGEQTVKVSGKNLFDIQDATGTRGNNTVVASNQTIIVNSNTSGTETAFYLNDCSYISRYSPTSYANARDYNMTGMGGDYTLKVYYQNIPSGTGALNTCIYTNKQTILKNRASIVNGTVEVTISLDNDEYIKSAVLYTANTNVFNNFTIKAQLEEGSTATSYEPYTSHNYTVALGSIELCKIGTYQDYIYKSGDDWYVHKATRKITIGGGTSWTKSQYGTNTYSISPAQEIAYSDDTENVVLVKSNCFIGVSYADRTVSTNNITYGAQSNTLFIRNTPFDTATELQTFCSNNNPVFYYALKTPTDTQITDVTLIGQLNAVHEWLTRYGYNATVSGNLPIIINKINL